MAQEVNFVQSGLLLRDAANAVRSPLGGLVEVLSPFVQGHPYEPFIRSFGVEHEKAARCFEESIEISPSKTAHIALADAYIALGAAASASAWGMSYASECYEGLGDLEQSEHWAQRKTTSYGGSSRLTWYLWCRTSAPSTI